MKKLLAVFLACSTLALTMTACDMGKNNNSESSQDIPGKTDSANEASGTEVSGSDIDEIEKGLIDEALVGKWFNETLGGSYFFRADGKLEMHSDYSATLHFTSENALINNIEAPFEYDGKKLTVSADNKTLGVPATDESGDSSETVVYDVVILERTDDENPDSIDGTYKLTGGEVYKTFSSIYSSYGLIPQLSMIINCEKLTLVLSMCEYSANGSVVQMFGDGAALFGLEDNQNAICTYEIDGNTLSITDSAGNKNEFSKVNE